MTTFQFDKFFNLQKTFMMVVLLLLLYENALWIYSTEGMLPKMPLRPFIMERNFVMNNDIDFFSNIVRQNNYILSCTIVHRYVK